MSRLTEQYDPYSFDDDTDGPGCGVQAHDDSCLCDVDVDAANRRAEARGEAVNPNDVRPLAYAELASRALYERDVAPTFQNWAAELLGLFEKARELGVQVKATPDQLDELRHRYIERQGECPQYTREHQRGLAEVKGLLAAGLSVDACARFLERPVREVVRCLTQKEGADLDAIAVAIDRLSRGAESYVAIERETGLNNQEIGRLASILGVESRVAANKARGGGYTCTAEQYAEIRRLRGEGKGYGAIAEKLGINKYTVAKYCQRHLRD